MIDLLVVALAFGAIFVVELPDKTFIATLVMSTKMRPLFVWIGVALAFLVQTGVAVGIGKAASFLPEQLIHTVAALMFVIGAIILFRAARTADAVDHRGVCLAKAAVIRTRQARRAVVKRGRPARSSWSSTSANPPCERTTAGSAVPCWSACSMPR